MLNKHVFIKLSQATVLLPVITGLRYYKKLDKSFKMLFYFFVISIGFEIQATICKNIFHNNMPGRHLFTVVEFLAFSAFYYMHVQKKNSFRILICINAIVFIGIAFLDAVFISGIKSPNNVSSGYSMVSISLYALVHFYALFQREDTRYVWEYPTFWISTGALIYFGGNALYYMLKGYLIANAADVEALNYITHAILNIISNCLYAQSFRCIRNQKTIS